MAALLIAPSPTRLGTRTAIGLGPHGERPATPDLILLSPRDFEAARAEAYRVAIVLHTTASDWAKRQVAGITEMLEAAGASVTQVVDCHYEANQQADALSHLKRSGVDAAIVIPVCGTAVSSALRKLARAGMKLVLLDNAPSGLLPDSDYVGVVSSDNFGLGETAAQLLAPHVRTGGSVGVITYKRDFFASAQREIAFRRWMARHRPDLRLHPAAFDTPSRADAALALLLAREPDLCGLFVVWDEPAMACMEMARAGPALTMTTVDLGAEIAGALSEGTLVVGVAAQRPFEQGRAAALAALSSLLGRPVPPWVVVPGIAVTRDTVSEAYAAVGGTPARLNVC